MMRKFVFSSKILICVVIFMFSITIVPSVLATDFHILKGTLYVDDEVIGEGAQIKLKILDDTFYIDTFEPDQNGYNYYSPGLDDRLYFGETVYFNVLYNGYDLIPVDNTSIVLNKAGNPVEEYIVDLHVYLPQNNPPLKPLNIGPENNSENVSIPPWLSVKIVDPDGDHMKILFYDASNDSLIGGFTNVASGENVSVSWTGLSANTKYYWYAVANDSEFETKSDVWCFRTKEKENEKPCVKIIKPCKGIYFNDKWVFPRFFRLTLIIGKITVEANATDDNGIEKVEFYINGKLKETDYTEPYSFNWSRDRIHLFHLFAIKVVAYDTDGKTDVDRMFVRKFL